MADHAYSSDPAVQQQLDRLAWLSPGRDVLGLDRIRALMARLGDPHLQLPPVFHVAGTNGKGSTCAFLRTALEAAGHTVHVYTSPHLVRFNERIRLAGQLISDAELAASLAEVLDNAGDIGPSFFEATTAAAFLAFARTPADACVVEVGLGGRLDATNILPAPLVTGIASLGIDHHEFLLGPDTDVPSDPLARIAFEKAGIAKSGVPLVTQSYPALAATGIAAQVRRTGVQHVARDIDWQVQTGSDHFTYTDTQGSLFLPLPALAGQHQVDNAALAIAMLRHQDRLPIDATAIAAALTTANWPARLQRLAPGPMSAKVAFGELWLDGGHNVDAARRINGHFTRDGDTRGKVDVIIGMLANKDAADFLRTIAPSTRSLVAVPVPGHAHHTPETLMVMARNAGIGHLAQSTDVPSALDIVADFARQFRPARGVAILGSLYLAGEVLKANGEIPN